MSIEPSTPLVPRGRGCFFLGWPTSLGIGSRPVSDPQRLLPPQFFSSVSQRAGRRREQGQRGRLMAREDQGHPLVAEWAVGHAATLVIARGQQAGEQVAGILAALAEPDDPNTRSR